SGPWLPGRCLGKFPFEFQTAHGWIAGLTRQSITSRRPTAPRRRIGGVPGWFATRQTSLYRLTPTRLTPPFKLPPALCRTAARATGRGLSTTPARATQPVGYSTYWQYTTALAGAGLSVRPASPNRALAAIPATVADLIERRFLGCMADSLFALAECRFRCG